MGLRLPRLGVAERQLILRCARVELDEPGTVEVETLLTRALAWESIVLFAEHHSVAPLVRHHLKGFEGSGLVPPAPRRRLLQLSHRAGYRNLMFRQAFEDLADALAASGVPVIVPKGLSLVELVYGNPSLRPLIDLVLFVRAEERERAIRVAAALGYADMAAPPLRRFDRWYSSQALLVRPGPPAIHLLLQWDLLNRPTRHALDSRRLWEDAWPTRLAGRAALVLAPVDLVLYLCLQAAKAGYLNVAAADVDEPATLVFSEWTNNRLIRFTDIFESIRHYRDDLDWTLLTERARAGGIASAVYAGLRWVTRLFGPAVDPGVFEALGSPEPRRVRRWLFHALTGSSAGSAPATVRGGAAALVLRNRTFPRRRLLRILDLVEHVFPRREELRRRLGRPAGDWLVLAYAAHVSRSLAWCMNGVLGRAYWAAAQRARTLTGLFGGRLRRHPRA